MDPNAIASDPLIAELIEAMREAYSNGGWLAVLAVCLLFAIRVFRLPVIQRLVPAKGRWTAWPQWLKWLSTFALAFGGALIFKYLSGVGWAAAAIGALASAGGSILGHQGTKAIGEIEGAKKSAKDPSYQPSGLRRAGGLLIPCAKHLGDNPPPPA